MLQVGSWGRLVSTNSSDIRIIVASHVPYWVPSDPLYLPMQVGSAEKESIPGFQRDDEGDSISHLNTHYSELTALYWGWKNLMPAMTPKGSLGFVHYRRYLAGSGERGILTQGEAAELLSQAPVVLPRARNYVIDTVEGHHNHTAGTNHIKILREVVGQRSPEFSAALNAHLSQTRTHICNMYIMRCDILDAWCSWLFPLLAEVDAAINYEELTAYQARAVGFLAEYLLDPWLKSEGISYVEVPMKRLEKVNLPKKAATFFAARFFGRPYTTGSE